MVLKYSPNAVKAPLAVQRVLPPSADGHPADCRRRRALGAGVDQTCSNAETVLLCLLFRV